MQATTELQRDLVLVGGGHSHALALRMFGMRPIDGLRITLISPASHTPYSGMLPGLIAGHYTFEDTHIDLARLCQWAGVRFLVAEVTGLDTDSRTLQLRGRPDVGYDWLSLDIGSSPELDAVPGAREYATPVKPVASLWQRWQTLAETVALADAPLQVALVGGGAGSVELALAMAHRLQGKVSLSLWSAGSELLQGYTRRARSYVMQALSDQDIAVHLGTRVVAVESGRLVASAAGEEQTYGHFDALFWCTAAAAAPWVAAAGLPTDEQGFLAVNDYLQSTGEGSVFGAGDIATQVADPRPKAGVYAVRQAPVLAHNLRALALNQPLRAYRPQRRFLSLLSLGTRVAVADRGVFSARGAWVWRWKDRIDRQFMARFSELPTGMAHTPIDRMPELVGNDTQMVCGGCGAKVGADTLRDVLAELADEFPRHCMSTGDDAVAVPAPAGATVLQSVDVLRQIIDDPWLMGRIAANHALSDLHACGVQPLSALAAITLPFARESLLRRDLKQFLAGALTEFAAVGCVLNGGHSLQGSELQLGFTVNGAPSAADGRLLDKTGSQPGDCLLLTKPLGTGVVFAAHMQQRADGRDVHAAVAAMLASNATAARLALQYGASACTDITGFGLLGHLAEMLAAGQQVELRPRALPLLPGVAQLLRAGITSSMYADNVASHARYLVPATGADAALKQVLFDPQTSGGLLIAVPAERAQVLLRALIDEDCPQAAIIGEVVDDASSGVAAIRLV